MKIKIIQKKLTGTKYRFPPKNTFVCKYVLMQLISSKKLYVLQTTEFYESGNRIIQFTCLKNYKKSTARF